MASWQIGISNLILFSVYFRILGPITDAEVIAEGRGIRIRKHLVRKYGDGNWRKMKGIAFVETRSDKGRLRFTGMSVMDAADSTTNSSGSSPSNKTFLLCISNQGVEASLEPRKVYESLPVDERESQSGFVRVIDEDGEDYLFPADFFAPIELSPEVISILSRAA